MQRRPPILGFPAVRADGHGSRLGLAFGDIGADWAEAILPWHADLAGDDGTVATGPLVALVDVAGSLAVWARRGRFVPHATLDLRLDRLRAAVAGRPIVARAECHRITPTLGFFRAEAHDGDPADPVVAAAGTYMVLADEAGA